MWEKRGWFNRFWQYLCEGSSFNAKGFGYSYAWSCSLREGRTFFCMVPISRKLSSFLLMSLALLHSVSYFFFLYRSPSLSLCTIYDTISSNINRFSQSSHLLIFLCLETLMSIARNVQPIVVEVIELVNSDLIISNDLTQMVHFATRIPDCDSVLFFLT